MNHLLIAPALIDQSILFSSCSHCFYLKDSDQKPPKPPIIPAAIPDEPEKIIPGFSIYRESSQEKAASDNLLPVMGVVSLLTIWFLYHHIQARGRRKNGIPLDDTDLALLGLAADTLSNLWRRVQQKSRSKIIPLHRRG